MPLNLAKIELNHNAVTARVETLHVNEILHVHLLRYYFLIKQDTWAGVNLHCRVANLRKVAWEVFGNRYRAFNR